MTSKFPCFWIAFLLVSAWCSGPGAEPDDATVASFIRIVEEVHPGDAWREIKVQLGPETRNALFAHYRSSAQSQRLESDGSIALSELTHPDNLHPEAIGVLVTHSAADGTGAEIETNLFRSLPGDEDAVSFDDIRIQIGVAGQDRERRRVGLREVMPPLWQFVSQELTIAERARLDFSIGIEPGFLVLDDVVASFRVGLFRGEERLGLFEETLNPRTAGEVNRWLDRSIDLSDYAGETIRVAFETEALRADGSALESACLLAPVIGNPVLRPGGDPATARPPNVLLISIDTLRADHLGVYGYPLDTSPAIDSFSKQGILFEKAIAPSSWTTPSHASIFTGLHPAVHGAGIKNVGNRVRPELTLLAEVARRQGHQTAAYTEGGAVQGSFGFYQGFDLYSDGLAKRHYRLAQETFDAATAWLERNGDQPYFLFVHTYEPHVPYRAPKRFWQRFSDARPDDDMMKHPEKYREHLAAWYDAEIAYTDHVLGGFFETLDEMGLLDNTLLILFSDHGEELYEHGGVGHRNNLYDEVLHVPLFVRLPGASPPAGRVDRLVTTTDVFATVLDFMGWPAMPETDSESLMPLIRGEGRGAAYTRELVHSVLVQPLRDHDLGSNIRIEWRSDSLRMAGEKYIRTDKYWVADLVRRGVVPGPDDAPEYFEAYFDMTQEAPETRNLASQHPGRVAHFRSLLESRSSELDRRYVERAQGGTALEPLTEEELAELEALGYLSGPARP